MRDGEERGSMQSGAVLRKLESFTVNKRYRLVPPDGGYGYFIVLAGAVNLVSTTMFYICFGIIFNDFFIKLGIGSTGVSFLAGVRAIGLASSGFLTGPLLKVMSRRKLAFVGSVIFNAGLFGVVFVNTRTQFMVCQGFLTTFGLGFLYNVSCTVINDYFLDKRLLTMGLLHAIAAAAGMVAPIVASWSMVEYGFRGTLIVVAAVGMQTFVATALLQPVARHLLKVPCTDAEEEPLTKDGVKNQLPIFDKLIESANIEDASVALTKSIDDMETPSANKDNLSWLKQFMDWPLFKRTALTCPCFGASIAIFADIFYVYNLAQALYAMKWNDDQIKWAFFLVSFGDLASRIVLIISSMWLKQLSNNLLYFIGLLIATVTKLAMLWMTDYIGALVCFVVMGVSRCIIVVLFPLVVSDAVPTEEFPSALGFVLMFYGLISITFGPIIGTIGDATDNFTVMNGIVVAIFGALTAVWAFDMLRDWRRKALKKRGKGKFNIE